MAEQDKKKESREDFKKRCKELRQNILNTILSKFPDEVIEHLGNSKKEVLLAIRSMIDEEIKKTDDDVTKAKEVKIKSQ